MTTTPKKRSELARRMAQTLFTSGPLGPGLPGESAEALVKPMLEAVIRQFPDSTTADFEAMIEELARVTDHGPSWQRLSRALLYQYVEKLTVEMLEEQVRQGKAVREIDPETGEAVYRWIAGR